MKKEELKILISVNESVKEIYDRMSLLEKQNKRNTEEFERLVECLKTTRNLERSIIDNINLTSETIKFISDEVSPIYNPSQNILDTIILNNQQSQNNIIYARIIQRLNEKLLLDGNQIIKEAAQSLLPPEALENLELEIDEKSLQDYTGIAETKLSIKRDISLFLYKLLEEEISKETNIERRNLLIDYKYSLIMLDSRLEETLMEKSFQPLENIFLESEIIAKLLNVSPNNYMNLINGMMFSIIGQELQNLIKTYDYELEYPKSRVAIIFKNLIIKSCLEFLPLDQKESIQNEFLKIIHSENYKTVHYSNKVLDLIISNFNRSNNSLEGVTHLKLKG